MIDAEAMRFLEFVEPLLDDSERALDELEQEANRVNGELNEALLLPDDLAAQLIGLLESIRGDIATTRLVANKAVQDCLSEARKFRDGIGPVAQDVEVAIQSRQAMKELPVALATAAESSFEGLVSNVEEAQAAAQTLATESIEQLSDALEEFQEEWTELADDLKEVAQSTLEEVCEDLVEAFLDETKGALNDATGGVLETVQKVTGAIEEIASTLKSSFKEVGEALQGVEKTIGAARPALEAISAVT